MKNSVSIPGFGEGQLLTRFLLFCGAASSLLYVGMSALIPSQFAGYDPTSQVLSELSAISAPTRDLWVPLSLLYIIMFGAFGWGVIRSAGDNRYLRFLGFVILSYALINIYWPPMHLRGAKATITDILHIVWGIVTVTLMMIMMVVGAASLNRNFRVYTIATLALYVVFGFLTGLEAPKLARNLPTPLLGLWERILIGLFLLWVFILSSLLLKKQKEEKGDKSPSFS